MKLLTKLRPFDAYAKPLEDFRIKTVGGAIITIISILIMSVLVWIEFMDYLTVSVTEELFVDTSRSPTMDITLDIVIPQISCEFVALDAMDSSGEQHLQIEHDIYKRRLDLQGNPIDEAKKEDITAKAAEKEHTEKVVDKPEDKTEKKEECGSCYGAETETRKCCNTCEEVREAYRSKRWALETLENITQCKQEKFGERMQLALHEGCQIYGSLRVNRVSGSFHVAPGKSFTLNHVHVHDVQPFASTAFNTTHEIRHLTFGASIDTPRHNPLKGTFTVAEKGATMFQYYIKIVPTAYVTLDNVVTHANQFSVTKHTRVISVMSGESGMPGAFFQYELSPLMVKYTETRRSADHFLINLCAIIGGIYTVSSLVDLFLYNFYRIYKKMEIGKIH